jgi:transposase
MGRGARYTDEFKQEAVNQVVVHGYPVLEVSERLGISNKSLYAWIKQYSKPKVERVEPVPITVASTCLINSNSTRWL